MSLIPLFLFSLVISISKCQNFGRFFNTFNKISDGKQIFDSYDFIVVGAGSGGSVIANRLSENLNWNVLLLEAGWDENFFTDVPLMATLQTITRYNWGYRGEKIKTACLGAVGGRCNLPRGKALGGTSVINFLIYSRGNRHDFDEWEHLGNTGWGYKDVLPFFIKSENCRKCREIDRRYHGFDGPLSIEHPGYESPLVKSFIKTGIDMGYNNSDVNAYNGTGFSKVQSTIRQGTRCSASKAFLKPVKDRPNLFISTQSQVTKILINPNTKIAYGVEFRKKNIKFVVRATKEIILSAGSFNSPQLLMLSGVGPKEHLEELNIPVIQDLKVGFNLQDHTALSTLAFLVNESITISDIGVQNPLDVFNYIWNGEGPLTLPGGAEALAFVKTKRNKLSIDYPDIELVLGNSALNGDVFGGFRSLLGIPNDVFEKVYKPVIFEPAFGIVPVLMRPRSRGRVLLRSSDPLDFPLIYPNYLENIEDVLTMLEGIRIAINISNLNHFQKFSTKLHRISMPGCEEHPFNSDNYWICVLKRFGTSLGHQVGTCKMGSREDKEAVVDSNLLVHGIEGLRVVDASIMPNIIAGHTNAAVFMIGEKASDMIKKKWTNK